VPYNRDDAFGDAPEHDWRELLRSASEFEDATSEQLRGAPDSKSTDADAVYDYVGEKQKAKIARRTGENEMRTKFFSWASKLTAAMMIGNFVVFAAYLAIEALNPDAEVPDAVMLAWITATVVEMIGVVAIIARHLFPGKKWQAPIAKPSIGEGAAK
jgi:hypothetical protein